MALNLGDLRPAPPQHPGPIEEEGRADQLAEVVHCPQLAGQPKLGIGEQPYREALGLDESGLGLRLVGRDAEDDRIQLIELLYPRRELLGLAGAARRAGLWVKIKDQILPEVVPQSDLPAVVGGELKVL